MTTLERIPTMRKGEAEELKKRLEVELHYATVGSLKNLECMLTSIDNAAKFEAVKAKADMFKQTMEVIQSELRAVTARLEELG